ncbi:MAG: hypothetical protein P8J27_12175 [Mariniblastus sp.]|nr:hypothetical protein [Mariniblastus sp.]
MSAKERANLITKLYKFVKKEYDVIATPSNRSVIEHLVYGCCLENSTFEAADDAFAKLQENYFDWNEIRVTTIAEIAEVTKGLSVPMESATGVKKTLHGVFEHYYNFDLDFLRKENLSKSVQTFQKFSHVSPFIVSYVAQNGLGGHSIPINRAMMSLFFVLGIVSEAEAAKGKVSGLERTIPKAKGVEFFNLTYQLAVEFASTPFKPTTREKLLKINPSAKERFPKRGGKKTVAAKPAPKAAAKVEKPAKKEKPAAKTKATKKVAAKKVKATTKKVAKKKPAKKSLLKRKK